ncbi:MAG: ComEC family competence protein [Patescibacteria group bacterium]|nr:ComEC family competence protein [Patescibacteria group bacterium]MCL5261728.1 ComEC family competence protein [Patescibacteria group bacterium]
MRPSEIFFSASVFFLAGVFAAGAGFSGVWALAATAAFSGGFLLFSTARKGRKWRVLSVCVWLMFAGCFYFHFRETLAESKMPGPGEAVFLARIVAEPELKEKTQVLLLKFQPPWRGEIVSYNRIYPEYAYGDLLRVTGRIEEGPRGRSVSFPQNVLVAETRGFSLRRTLYGFKSVLESGLRKTLPLSEAGFAIAMTLGDDSLLSKTFLDNLKKTGTSHLIALSGYNVLIVIAAVQTSLAAVGLKRRSFWFSALFILGFVLMTGAAASVVRAAIMSFLSLIARRNDRVYSAKNPVVFAGLAMVLVDPRLLVFDLGFQLSFLAFFGIAYLAPFLKGKLRIEDRGFLGWKDNAVQTVSAQAMVAPLLIVKTGGFSALSVVPNIFVLAVTPLIMFGGFAVAGLAIVSKPLAIIVGWGLQILLNYAEAVINLCARFM